MIFLLILILLAPISVKTDKRIYLSGNKVKISVHIPPDKDNREYLVTVFNSGIKEASFGKTLDGDNDDTDFFREITVHDGNYVIVGQLLRNGKILRVEYRFQVGTQTSSGFFLSNPHIPCCG